MTKATRFRIVELRKTGMSYQEIANEIGESKDAVRYICKSRGLGGVADERTSSERKICVNCGKDVNQPTGKGRPKRFCCEQCRREWWKNHPNKAKRKESAFYSATCKHCGKEFLSYGNNHRQYCSRECYINERFWAL